MYKDYGARAELEKLGIEITHTGKFLTNALKDEAFSVLTTKRVLLIFYCLLSWFLWFFLALWYCICNDRVKKFSKGRSQTPFFTQ